MGFEICEKCKDSGYLTGPSATTVYCDCDIGKTTKVLDTSVLLGLAFRASDGRYVIKDGVTEAEIFEAHAKAGTFNG